MEAQIYKGDAPFGGLPFFFVLRVITLEFSSWTRTNPLYKSHITDVGVPVDKPH